MTIVVTGATGNVAPMREISGSRDGLAHPWQIAFDAQGRSYVTDWGPLHEEAAFINVYAANANGNAGPIAKIAGLSTGLRRPEGIALDSAVRIYVANDLSNSVTVFAPGSNGNAAPTSRYSCG